MGETVVTHSLTPSPSKVVFFLFPNTLMLFLLEIPPTLFGLHLEKMPAYSSASGEDKFSVRAVFSPLDIPSVYPKSRKSLFIKKCFFFPVLDVLLSSSRPSLET